MHLFIEFLFTLWLVVKSIACGIFYAFSLKKRKVIEGEIALITGAGSGLGRLMCCEFAKRGATIVALDNAAEANEETRAYIEKRGGTAYAYTCDVGYVNSVRLLL